MSIKAVIITKITLYFVHWPDSHFPRRKKGKEKESNKKEKNPPLSSSITSSFDLSFILAAAKKIKEKKTMNIIFDKIPKLNLSNPHKIRPKEAQKVPR